MVFRETKTTWTAGRVKWALKQTSKVFYFLSVRKKLFLNSFFFLIYIPNKIIIISKCNNFLNKKKKCQICVERCLERGKASGRSDDNEDTLTKRIKTYTESTLPIIQHFEKLNLVKKIDAAKTEDQVYEDVEQALHALNL